MSIDKSGHSAESEATASRGRQVDGPTAETPPGDDPAKAVARPPIPRPQIAPVDLAPFRPIAIRGDAIAAETLDERTRSFWDFYRSLPRVDGLPSRASADALALRPWMGNLMILDPLDHGRDFTYRLYGSNIAEVSGFEMTGRRVSEFSSPTGQFFMDNYRQCLVTREPVLTRNVAEHARGFVKWERLVTVFRTGKGGIQIVATNIPQPLPQDCSHLR